MNKKTVALTTGQYREIITAIAEKYGINLDEFEDG